MVAEVTLHALIVIGLQTADLSSDLSINSINILGQKIGLDLEVEAQEKRASIHHGGRTRI